MKNVISYFERAMGLTQCAYTEEEKQDIDLICSITDADELEEGWLEEYDKLSNRDIDEDDTEGIRLNEMLTKHWISTTRKDYRKETIIEDYLTTQASMGPYNYRAEHMRYFPEQYNRNISKRGDWIMVIDAVPVKPAPIQYSVYYAMPANLTKDITPWGSNRAFKFPYHKVKVMIEGAEVHLWPHEYIKVPLDVILEEVGNSFDRVELGGNPSYDVAKLHFLKLRGISQVDVYKILLKSVNSIIHVYFKIRPEAVEFWDFYIDALQKGVRPEMAIRVWDCRVNNKPLFNVTVVQEDENSNNQRKGTKKDHSK